MNLLYLLLLYLVHPHGVEYANTVISIDNLDLKLAGNVKVQVFDEHALHTGIMDPVMEKTITAHENQLPVKLDKLPTGKYMIAVLHDANGNGKLDYSFFGVPKEGYGFSGQYSCKVKSAGPSQHIIQLSPGLQHVTIHLCY
ncbi:hypothetical protein DN752_00810 [Echinicola strongylocentroti]|uniref:DUF2141 domain-containing protein n=1 Tax=Echinicola strongylocentroti TaxID=1795355 RepID=A0A2Z4IDK3_9BACT|nr:DUF2141 domain-containing protein [Echinicola strongylocentroti]AWW28787.1 hypothetical protein DN752_00810 [Echinicola strongylocentroti]